MDSLMARRLEALETVQGWAKREPRLFRPGTPAATCLRRIDAAVAIGNREMVAERRGATAEFTGERPQHRRRLRAALMALCRATQVLDAETPGLTVVYRRPPYLSDAGLIDCAERMLNDLEPVQQRLLAVLDLPESFFDTVRQRMRALAGAGSEQQDARRSHVAARRAIEAALASGFAALKTLDIIVRHYLEGDEVKLSGWRDARRIPRSRHRRRRAKTQAA